MHFQVKMSKNGRKNIFREKEITNKVLPMLLDVKNASGKVTIVLLDPVNKQARYTVCI